MNIEKILDFENWEIASLDYISKSLKKKKKIENIQSWNNFDKELSPFSLYKLLKAKFGIPNGMSMLFKRESTENLIHWHYTLLSNKSEIHFLGKSSGVEILLKLEPKINFEDSNWDLLITSIKSSYANYGSEMKKVQEEFQKYTLFINPFTRLRDSLSKLISELKTLDTKEIKRINNHKVTDEERTEYYKRYNKWINNVERSVSLGTTIRMLSPVLAESFINTLLFVFAKKEFKNDKRLYENLIRQNIDIRVKTLHLNCDGFKKPVQAEEKEFKDFLTLMNNRNDFLHGNIDPTKLMFEDVYFDMEYIPLFKEDEGIITKTMKNYLQNVEAEKTFKDYITAQKFIDFILDHLGDEPKNYMEHLLMTRMPGYNHQTKGIGILFPVGLAEI
jgi:hypothetical protein